MNDSWARRSARARGVRARDVALEVRGRKSGKQILFPVVLADVADSWYAVSMLGQNANWVRNVRAAGGRARLHSGEVYDVELREVPVEERAPVLLRYLEVAPGGRPHIPTSANPTIDELTTLAPRFPVFEVVGFAPSGS